MNYLHNMCFLSFKTCETLDFNSPVKLIKGTFQNGRVCFFPLLHNSGCSVVFFTVSFIVFLPAISCTSSLMIRMCVVYSLLEGCSEAGKKMYINITEADDNYA